MTETMNIVVPGRARRRPRNGRSIIAWIVIAVAMAVSLLPFYWVLRTSLSLNSKLAAGSADLLPVG